MSTPRLYFRHIQFLLLLKNPLVYGQAQISAISGHGYHTKQGKDKDVKTAMDIVELVS